MQDLWIASQALQHSMSLLTRNGEDFRGLPGLQLVPYQRDRETAAKRDTRVR